MESSIQQIKEALEPVVEKLGEGAKFGYEVLMRQVIIDAVALVLVCMGLLALSAITYKFAVKPILEHANKVIEEETYSEWEVGRVAILIFFWGFVGFVALALIIGAVDLIKVLFNPHYYTIQRALEVIRGTVGQ